MSVGQGNITVDQKRDGWIYVVLGADFTTTINNTVTGNPVPGLFFTPLRNTRYEFEMKLMVSSSVLTTGIQSGIFGPTSGLISGMWHGTQYATTVANNLRNQSGQSGLFGGSFAGTGVGAINEFNPCLMWGIAIVGPNPIGNINVTLSSEIAGTAVSMRRDSFIKYRTY